MSVSQEENDSACNNGCQVHMEEHQGISSRFGAIVKSKNGRKGDSSHTEQDSRKITKCVQGGIDYTDNAAPNLTAQVHLVFCKAVHYTRG